MIYLGQIRPAYGDSRDAQGLWVALAEIVAVIPWQKVPTRRRERVLDRLRPVVGPVRYLVALRDGREIPTAVEVVRKVKATHRRRVRVLFPSSKVGDLPEGWATVADLSEVTGYNPDHLRLLARSGRVAAHKAGGRWWIHERSLEIYAGGRRPGPGCRRGARR